MSYEHVPDENAENLDPNVAFLANLDHQMDVLAGLDDVNKTMEEIRHLDDVDLSEHDPVTTPDARAAIELLEIDEAFTLMRQYEAEVKQAADEAAARLLIQSVFEPHPDVVDFADKAQGVDYFLQDHPAATDQEKDDMAARIFNVESPKMPQYPKLQYRRIIFDPTPKGPDMADEIYEQRGHRPLYERPMSGIEILRQYPGLLKLMKEM